LGWRLAGHGALGGNGPYLAVIVPARSRPQHPPLVEALLAQTYPNYGVYVVDDRSTATGAIWPSWPPATHA
jgi:cellulose synthase/poly-beta-1,6-N-acetylglucosamine synthase-like glycosyltransferase